MPFTASALATFPPAGDPFAAAGWFESLLTGSLGTTIAVIAVAWFGFELLAGRLSLRRGGVLVLGCFILFGASSIASSLISTVRTTDSGLIAPEPQTIAAPPPAIPAPPNYDPYAGASVPQGN